jgi:hypothetical protein
VRPLFFVAAIIADIFHAPAECLEIGNYPSPKLRPVCCRMPCRALLYDAVGRQFGGLAENAIGVRRARDRIRARIIQRLSGRTRILRFLAPGLLFHLNPFAGDDPQAY